MKAKKFWPKLKNGKIPHFSGPDYDAAFDYERLSTQALKIWVLMRSGKKYTLPEVERDLNISGLVTSFSAAMREFRKEGWGYNIVEKQRREHPTQGLWEYWLTKNPKGTLKWRKKFLLKIGGETHLGRPKSLIQRLKERGRIINKGY